MYVNNAGQALGFLPGLPELPFTPPSWLPMPPGMPGAAAEEEEAPESPPEMPPPETYAYGAELPGARARKIAIGAMVGLVVLGGVALVARRR